jgi:hypothetical protein
VKKEERRNKIKERGRKREEKQRYGEMRRQRDGNKRELNSKK